MKWLIALGALAGCGSVADNKHDAATTIDTPMVDTHTVDGMTCAANPSGLGGRWRAEMNMTDDVAAHDGAPHGTINYTPGKHGFAFLFDGSTNAVSIDDGDLLWPAASFSLEAWIKTTSVAGGNIVVKYQCSIACPANSNAYWELGLSGTGHASFQLRTDASANIDSIDDTLHAINDNQWHHLVGVRDTNAGTAVLYIDGALAVSQNLPADELGAMTNTDGALDPIIIGGSLTGGTSNYQGLFAGAVDEVSYYASALSGAQVAAIYAAPDGECH